MNRERLSQLAGSLHEPLSNRELLLRSLEDPSAAERSRAAEELRRRLKSPCAAAVARFARTVDELEDYTQRLYERLVRKCRAGKDPGELSDRYLSLMAESLIRTDFRRLKFTLVSLEEDGTARAQGAWDRSPSAEDEAVRRLCARETHGELARRMQRLKPREADVVRQRADGHPYDQIAGTLGITEENARQIFRRARRFLTERAVAP